MKNIILLFFLTLSTALGAQDTLSRIFNATVTFNNFSQTNTGRFSGTLAVNDQSGRYSADSVLVGDYVYAQSTAMYVVDTVSSKNFANASVVIRRISGPTGAPFGRGDITRPTRKFKLYTFTPDNANGVSSQAQFVKLSAAIVRIDSLIDTVRTLALADVQDGDKGDVGVSGGTWTIDTNAVTTIKIQDGAVTTAKIQDGAVTGAKVGSGVVTTNAQFGGLPGYIPQYVSSGGGNIDSITNSIIRQSSSKIGVGITPDSTFTVDGSGRFVTSVTATKFIPTGNVTAGDGMYKPDASSIAFSLDGAERMKIIKGVNTTGSVVFTGDFFVKDTTPSLIFENVALPNNQRYKFFSSTSDYSFSIGQFNVLGIPTSQMLVDSFGRVGIGTQFPSERLHVEGKLRVTDLTKSGNSRGLVAFQSDGTLDTIVIGSGISLVSDTLRGTAGISSGTLSSGAVTVAYSLFGTGTPTLTETTQGTFEMDMPANTNIRSIVVSGNDTELAPSLGFTFVFDNSANSSDYWLTPSLYSISNNQLIDQHATSTNHTQTVSSNKSTLVFPGMNLFGATGFRIVIK
jgi:hypothetical protein